MPTIHVHLHRRVHDKSNVRANSTDRKGRYSGLNERMKAMIRISLQQRIEAGGSSGEEAKKLLAELDATTDRKAKDFQIGSRTDKLWQRIDRLKTQGVDTSEVEKAMRTNNLEAANVMLNRLETSR